MSRGSARALAFRVSEGYHTDGYVNGGAVPIGYGVFTTCGGSGGDGVLPGLSMVPQGHFSVP